MSLNGLCPTRIKANRVISTFLFNPASSRAHRIPIEGNLLEGGLRNNRMPPEGFADPVTSDGTKFCSNIPISELIKRITRAIKASVINSAPPVAETEDGVARENTANP